MNTLNDSEEVNSLLHLLYSYIINNEDDRELVGNILVPKCYTKDCLLFLTGHDVLTGRCFKSKYIATLADR